MRASAQAAVALAAFAVSVLLPVCAYAGDVKAYYTRHVTLWYQNEAEFVRLEDSLRSSTRPPVGSYGSDSDFLAGRMDRLFRAVSVSLGPARPDLRIDVELVSRRDRALVPGDGVTGGLDTTGVTYDPRSGTLYMDSSRLGPVTLCRGFALAIASHWYAVRPPELILEVAAEQAASWCRTSNAGQFFIDIPPF